MSSTKSWLSKALPKVLAAALLTATIGSSLLVGTASAHDRNDYRRYNDNRASSWRDLNRDGRVSPWETRRIQARKVAYYNRNNNSWWDRRNDRRDWDRRDWDRDHNHHDNGNHNGWFKR